ncbi:hypothetical protein JW978_04270 [Candidatus Dojkabacteria bacterium]|nr:hypothetical protein [Candidatus Dojkabacteria bacterium]
MKNKEFIINEAKKLLQENPLDAGHDLSHHERVNELALDIAKQIGDKKLDLDVLEIASMWHDVQLKEGLDLSDYLKARLYELKFGERFTAKVAECIRSHSFNQDPELLEAQILYDADKLDTLSIERGRKVAKSLLNRDMDGARKQIYINVGKAWIKEMRQKLHFDVTKRIYDERVKTILQSKEVDKLAQRLEIDISEVKDSLMRDLSIKDRILIFISKYLYKLKR